jgi:hypothetical protein
VGSAEPFLRSQEGSGKEGLSRFARGRGLIAFNARSGTIPLRCDFEWAPRRSAAVFGGSAEPFLRSQEGLGKEELSRFARGRGLIAFNARSGTIPLRCDFEWAPRRSAAVFGGSAEPFLRSQEGSGKGGLSRFARGRGLIAFNARSGTIPLRCGFEWAPRRSAAVFEGSAEPFLRSQEGSGKGRLSRFARGMGLIAFNARSGTIPLRCGFEWASRRSAAVFGGSAESVLRSQEGSGKEELSRFARGMGLIAFNARSGTIPLPLRSGLLNRGALVLGTTLESRVDCGCPIWDEKDAQYRCCRCIP